MPEFVFRFGSDAANRTVNVYDQSGQLAYAGTTGPAVSGEVEYTATLPSGVYVGEVKTVAGWVRAAGFLDATTAELSATYATRTGQPDVTDPGDLWPLRKALGQAMFQQVAIYCEGDSITAGGNANDASIVTLTDKATARTRGWVSQLRTLFAQRIGIDPGEGSVFLVGDEGRWTYAGGTPAGRPIGPVQSGGRIAATASATGTFTFANLDVIAFSPGQTGHLPRVEVDGVDVRSTMAAAGCKAGTVGASDWQPGNGANMTVANSGTRALTVTATTTTNLRADYLTKFDVVVGQRIAVTTQAVSTIVGRSLAGEITFYQSDGTTVVSTVTTNSTTTVNGTVGVTSFFTVPANAAKARFSLTATGYVNTESIQFKDFDVVLMNDWQSPGGAGNMGRIACTAVTDGSHSLALYGGLAGVVDVANIYLRRRTDAGVVVHCVGKSGSTAADHAGSILSAGDQAAMFAAGFDFPNVSALPPVALRIIGLGTNEFSNQTYDPATYKTHLTTLVTKAVAKGECVLLVAGSRYSDNTGKTWPEEDYYAQAKALAQATDKVAYIDLADSWGTATQMNTKGFRNIAVQGIHPTLAGHGDYARMIFNALTGQTFAHL